MVVRRHEQGEQAVHTLRNRCGLFCDVFQEIHGVVVAGLFLEICSQSCAERVRQPLRKCIHSSDLGQNNRPMFAEYGLAISAPVVGHFPFAVGDTHNFFETDARIVLTLQPMPDFSMDHEHKCFPPTPAQPALALIDIICDCR